MFSSLGGWGRPVNTTTGRKATLITFMMNLHSSTVSYSSTNYGQNYEYTNTFAKCDGNYMQGL